MRAHGILTYGYRQTQYLIFAYLQPLKSLACKPHLLVCIEHNYEHNYDMGCRMHMFYIPVDCLCQDVF